MSFTLKKYLCLTKKVMWQQSQRKSPHTHRFHPPAIKTDCCTQRNFRSLQNLSPWKELMRSGLFLRVWWPVLLLVPLLHLCLSHHMWHMYLGLCFVSSPQQLSSLLLWAIRLRVSRTLLPSKSETPTDCLSSLFI